MRLELVCLTLVVLGLFVQASPAVEAADVADDSRTISANVPPEFYVPNPNANYCLVMVKFGASDRNVRRDALLKFVGSSYSRTEKWKKDYAIIGVDYIDFSSLHLVSYSDCDGAVRLARSAVASILNCGRAKSCKNEYVALDKTSPLFTSSRDEMSPFGMSVFDKYVGRAHLQECTLGIGLKNWASLGPKKWAAIDDSMLGLIWKFRMPIVDLKRINGTVFITFARECAKKKQYYSVMAEIISRENPGVTQLFDRIDYSPELAPYIYSETGGR